MAKLTDLEQQNPNIQQQMEEWQQQRLQNKELSRNWEDFRQHVIALGAPDPGTEAPQEFFFRFRGH